jgi:hypothetical protein
MKTRTRSISIGIGLFLLGTAVGVAGSQRFWFRWALTKLDQEVVGRANLDIVVLSKWRTGSEAEARVELEGAVDRAVESVYGSAKAFQKPVPKSAVKMIQLAKVYRTAFPPPADSPPSLFEALNSVEMPSRKYCSPALQKLMSDAQSKAAPTGGT